MTPPFAVAMRDGSARPFGNVVDAKRFLDRTAHAARLVRARDGVVMAYKARVNDEEMAHLARLFRKHD